MRDAGVQLIADFRHLAVMGAVEAVRRLPTFLALERRTRRLWKEQGVQVFLPVDFPGLNMRLAGAAKRRGMRVLYYIAPQVWAWRQRRAKKLARRCDRVLTVLPFEAPVLGDWGVDARYVGHPLLDEVGRSDSPRAKEPDAVAGPERARPRGGTLGIFPGSRAQEVGRILPVFADAARHLQGTHPGVRCVVARAPHLPGSLFAGCGLPLASTGEVIAQATAALTKSGTITLELALARIPMVVGYAMSPLEWGVVRSMVKVDAVALPNLLAGREVIPELLQGRLTPSAAAAAVAPLLDRDSPRRRQMVEDLGEVAGRLGGPGCADRVAAHCEEFLA